MAEVGSVLVLNERDLEHPKAGGAEVHVFELFERLVDRGARVTLATSSFEGAPTRVRMRGHTGTLVICCHGVSTHFHPVSNATAFLRNQFIRFST